MVTDRLSVVISVYNGAGQLERCLRSLAPERPWLEEVVVVDDGSSDRSGEVARMAGCELVRLPTRRGISVARNTGAYAATGDILVFIDADTEVRPGWAGALRAAFAGGAVLAGGGLRWPEAHTLSEWYQSAGRWHDEEARNGFLPFASGAHFAIRRDVFLRLGGFDELLPVTEDLDLSLRAQLAGYPIAFVPEAEIVHWPRSTVRGLLRQRMRHARNRRLAEAKFRSFPFLRMDRSRRGAARVLAASASSVLMAGTGGDTRRLTLPLLRSGVAAATRLGMRRADLELLSGLVPMPPPYPFRDPEQHNTCSPLPGAPSFLLLGNDRLVMRLLRLAVEGGRDAIVASPGLEREALDRWDQPAPWSLRLVRSAVRAGWPLALETAALRVEREQPRTWGEAFLTLHRVHAWAHERPRYGLAALGDSGWRLAGRLAELPIVMAGDERRRGDRVVLQVDRRHLFRDRRRVYAALYAELSR